MSTGGGRRGEERASASDESVTEGVDAIDLLSDVSVAPLREKEVEAKRRSRFIVRRAERIWRSWWKVVSAVLEAQQGG